MCDGHAWMDIHMIGYCLELAKQHHKLSAIAQTHATIQKSIVLNKRQSFSEYDGYIIVFMSCVSSSGCRGSDASPPSAGESGRMRRRAYSPPELYAIPTTGTSITIAPIVNHMDPSPLVPTSAPPMRRVTKRTF